MIYNKLGSFPDGFLWGASIRLLVEGVVSEDGKSLSIIDMYEHPEGGGLFRGKRSLPLSRGHRPVRGARS
ncbi:MAG: family 1 glycosylhydrolase [Eisenbergiella sp.]